MPFAEPLWAAPRDECWDLSVLGTNPACQGQSIGRRLVSWGLQRADEEHVAASVVSADGKEKFYQLCGYGEIAGCVTEGEGNPLAGVRGGIVLFRDAKP
jgi:predicted N-acetyltransferase YhbS